MFYKKNLFLITSLAIHCISLGVVSTFFFLQLNALKVVYVLFILEWINIVVSALCFLAFFLLQLTNSLKGVFSALQFKALSLKSLAVPFLYSVSSIILFYFFWWYPVPLETGSLSSDAREAAYESYDNFLFFVLSPIYVAVSIVLTLIQLRLNQLKAAVNEKAK